MVNEMARNTQETNATVETNANANAAETIESMESIASITQQAVDNQNRHNILDLVPVYGTDAIQVKQSANNYLLGTLKLKAQVEIGLGNDESLLHVSNKLPVTIAKTFADGTSETKTVYLSLAFLLAAGSNGLFELVNTNVKDAKGFTALVEAFANGYFYPSSYELSQKQPAFNWANFIIWLKGQDYGQSELAPKVQKFLTLTTRQISSLTDEQLRQVSWLYPLIVSKGYTPAKPAEQSLLADLM